MKKLIVFMFIAIMASCGQGDALTSATAFADRVYPNAKDGSCVAGMSADSDDDGYVSCQVITAEGKAVPLQCGTNHAGCGPKGCKVVQFFN